MGIFKNEKIDKVNEQLSKLETKRDEIAKAIADIEEALEKTVELYAVGEIGEKEIEESHEVLNARRQELADVERMIAKVVDVRKKVAIESVPMVKEWRRKRAESAQKEIDKAVEEARKIRVLFAQKLAEVGQAKKKFDSVNGDFDNVMRELGQPIFRGNEQGNVPKVIPGEFMIGMYPSVIPIERSLGLDEDSQENIVRTGDVPSWATASK